MPTYRVTSPDGRIVRLTGDSPPTESELEGIFRRLPAKMQAEAEPVTAAQPNAVGSLETGLRQANPFPIEGEENALGTYARLPGEMAKTVSGYLPAAGATLGGILGLPAGLPGVMAGGAIGAAGGEAGKQLIEEARGESSRTPRQAADAIATEGAVGLLAPPAFKAGAGVLKFGARPIATGLATTAKAVYNDKPLMSAALKGIVAGVKAIAPAEKKALQARVMHIVRRSVPEAQTAAISAVQKAATVQDIPTEAILGDLEKRVTTMNALGISSNDIAASLQKAYKIEGRGEGLTLPKMHDLVKRVIGAKPEPPKALTDIFSDEVEAKVVSLAEAGLSRAQMAASLRELHPDKLTPSAARKMVDLVLDTYKIGLSEAAPIAKAAASDAVAIASEIEQKIVSLKSAGGLSKYQIAKSLKELYGIGLSHAQEMTHMTLKAYGLE